LQNLSLFNIQLGWNYDKQLGPNACWHYESTVNYALQKALHKDAIITIDDEDIRTRSSSVKELGWPSRWLGKKRYVVTVDCAADQSTGFICWMRVRRQGENASSAL